jgi:ADP-ribose pyrophosphatase
VPAGKLDAGEPPEHCAAREVEEEVGWRAGRLVPLGGVITTPGFTDEVIWLYEGHDLEAGHQQLEADEVLDVLEVPFAEAVRMCVSGEISDAKTICAVLLAHARRSA